MSEIKNGNVSQFQPSGLTCSVFGLRGTRNWQSDPLQRLVEVADGMRAKVQSRGCIGTRPGLERNERRDPADILGPVKGINRSLSAMEDNTFAPGLRKLMMVNLKAVSIAPIAWINAGHHVETWYYRPRLSVCHCGIALSAFGTTGTTAKLQSLTVFNFDISIILI
ncbi:hypothetical protein C8R44DRAFT_858578 [Mycena epipterygia]|nr:hypothetical protein C8R44DRAFT_858578 [Mycena epipterygia]